MKPGAGKRKGSSFERDVSRALSLWITNGKLEDCLWRSAMSGGRATAARKKGSVVRQAGDITAVAPEGHVLTDHWYIECKFYKDFEIASMLIANTGKLASFWNIARHQSAHHKKFPMLIFKSNRMPVLVIVSPGTLEQFIDDTKIGVPTVIKPGAYDIWHFDALMQTTWTRAV